MRSWSASVSPGSTCIMQFRRALQLIELRASLQCAHHHCRQRMMTSDATADRSLHGADRSALPGLRSPAATGPPLPRLTSG